MSGRSGCVCVIAVVAGGGGVEGDRYGGRLGGWNGGRLLGSGYGSSDESRC